MLHDIEDVFDNHWEDYDPKPHDKVLAFSGNELLFAESAEGMELPCVRDVLKSVDHRTLREAGLQGTEDENPEFSFASVTSALHDMFTFLFSVGKTRFFLVISEELARGLAHSEGRTPENFRYHPTTEFRGMADHDLSFVCQVGHQLNTWYTTRRFCGKCGSKAKLSTKERMIYCPECGTMEYPKICPGVIVAVVNSEGKLLMSRYLGRPYTAHALIAGFTEIGEPIEDTVRREVMEEVGLKVKNITFYGSQPWPPSSSLLVGFFCEVDGADEITLDRTELAEAAWYGPEEVPSQDDNYSLTREMMVFFHDNAGNINRMIHEKIQER